MKIEVRSGHPSQEELAALVAAIQGLRLQAQSQVIFEDSGQQASRWQMADRLQRSVTAPWGIAGAAWQRSERLANPWLD